jgi:uncharacterized membrane protein YukC
MNFFKYLFIGLILIMIFSMAACSFKADLRNPWQSNITDTRICKG